MLAAILGVIAALSLLGLVIASSATSKPRSHRAVALLVAGFLIPVGLLALQYFFALYVSDLGPGIGKLDPPIPLSEHLIYGPLSMAVLALVGLAATGVGIYVLGMALLRKRK
jgi:hypothetical protein